MIHDSNLIFVILIVIIIFLIAISIWLKLKFADTLRKAGETVRKMKEEFAETIPKERDDALEQSRSKLKGKISEQMAPFLPEFSAKYESSDARFLGSPIDFVVFKDMSKFNKKTKEDDVPIEVVLVEIKTGDKASLSTLEKAIKKAVDEGRVSFDVIRQNIERPNS